MSLSDAEWGRPFWAAAGLPAGAPGLFAFDPAEAGGHTEPRPRGRFFP